MKHKITEAGQAPVMPESGYVGARKFMPPGGGGPLWILFLVAAAFIVATQVKKIILT